MTRDAVSIVYSCPEHIVWVKDTKRVIVVDELRGQSFTLRGVEAALWSWLTLRYAYPKLITLLAGLLNAPDAEAEQRLHSILRDWHTQGLLETVDG